MLMQQFEAELYSEELAQNKYYEMKANARSFIEPKMPKLLPSKKLLMSSSDNISMHSAPTLTRSTSGGHLTVSATSPPPAVRLRKYKGHKLANSASTNSLSRKSTSHSQTSLTILTAPRPKSYVPFQGCVETPSPLPGRAAHDILHALSYAPTHESFSAETQQSFSVSQHHSQSLSRNKQNSARNNYPLLKSKSSSFASLMCTQGIPDDLICTASPFFSNDTHAINQNPVMYVQTEMEPIYAPTNPLNHPENRAVFNAHPPVIYPPPDLVPSIKPEVAFIKPEMGTPLTPVKQVSSPNPFSTFCTAPASKAGPGLVVMTGSPGPIHDTTGNGLFQTGSGLYQTGNGHANSNIVRRSNASLGSPGLSSASSSGFETARSSSSSSSMSSIMFDPASSSMAGNNLTGTTGHNLTGTGYNLPGLTVQNTAVILESIRETSPMTSTSISRF